MAESKDSKPVSIFNVIRKIVEDDGKFDLDTEWSLFTRFGQSVFKFCTKTWKESEVKKLLDRIEENKSSDSNSFQTMINSIAENDGMAKTITMLVNEAITSREEMRKCCNKAKTIREEGTEHFKKKQYKKALERYSKAIAYAPSGSEELTVCLANRSATFYHLGLFKECLKDISIVLSNQNYPSEKLYMIYARQIQCLKGLNRDYEAQEIAQNSVNEVRQKINDEKLRAMMCEFIESSLKKECKILKSEADSHSSRKVETSIKEGGFHDSIPDASNKIEMKQNDMKGRYIVASQDIPASTVLLKDESIAFWLRPSQYDSYCFNCFKSISRRHFIPCTGCTFAKFCSEECLKKSKIMFHEKECDNMNVLSIMSIGHTACRLIYRLKLDKQINTRKKSMINSLVDNLKNFPPEMLVSLSLSSLFLANLLVGTKADAKLETDLAALILRRSLQIHCNAVGIQHHEDEMYSLTEPNIRIIGMGLYPSVALMNHSCDKRTYTIFEGSSSLCIKSSIDIKSGDEITLCYGPFFRRMSCKDRQDYTRKNYFFECDCSCCLEKKEPIGSAFACPPPCSGPVIFSHSDSSSKCLKCDRKIGSDASQFYLSKLAEVKDQLLEDWNALTPEGRWSELQKKLTYLLEKYSPFFYSSSEIIRELKEKLAIVHEEMKMVEPAAKLWLECYKITKELEEGDDNYECLFYLCKITSTLIEEADKKLGNHALVRSHVDKAMKYYKKCMMISKRLHGKEVKLLETSPDILQNIPNLASIESDLKNLISYCSLIK